jgi:hypothetical protein
MNDVGPVLELANEDLCFNLAIRFAVRRLYVASGLGLEIAMIISLLTVKALIRSP